LIGFVEMWLLKKKTGCTYLCCSLLHFSWFAFTFVTSHSCSLLYSIGSDVPLHLYILLSFLSDMTTLCICLGGWKYWIGLAAHIPPYLSLGFDRLPWVGWNGSGNKSFD